MFSTFLKILLFPIKLIFIFCIYFYKIFISPLLPKSCAFYPTCSTYCLDAIKDFGVIRGGILGVKRICRCTPKSKGGEDYLPHNVKGANKWIY